MSEHHKLRILQVALSGTIGTAQMGPVSATICALANGFERLGHGVTVCDTRTTEPRSRMCPRIRVVTVPIATRRPRVLAVLPARLQAIYEWLSAIAYLWRLHRLVRLDTFDVVHVHDHRLACLFALFAPGRYFFTSHDSVWALVQDQGAKVPIGGKLGAWLEAFAIRRSRATIALGDYLARQLPGERIETIAHGLDPAAWQPLDHVDARTALNIGPEEFTLVFVGRIHPQKGLDVLIEAVRQLAPQIPALRLHVIGSPGGRYAAGERPSRYALQLVRQARGLPVRFVGFLSNQSLQLRQYLSAADLAVVPSRHEPFGYVALEALAMSVPVIASRTGGLAQTVTDDVGTLVPPEDVCALVAAIRTLYDDRPRLARMGANCRARVVERFSRDESIRRHVALFETSSQAIELAASEGPAPHAR